MPESVSLTSAGDTGHSLPRTSLPLDYSTRLRAGRLWSADNLMHVLLGLQIFLIGALAKLGATVVTYPLLLVKSRLMSQSKTDAAEHQYTGTLDAILRIYKNDGARHHTCKCSASPACYILHTSGSPPIPANIGSIKLMLQHGDNPDKWLAVLLQAWRASTMG